LNSLRTRLVLLTLIVAAVAVTTVGLLSQRLTLIEFQRFVTNTAEVRAERFAATFEAHYRERGSWEGIQPLVEQVGEAAGRQLVLVGPGRAVVAAHPRDLLQSELRLTSDHSLSWERTESTEGQSRKRGYQLQGVPHVLLRGPSGEQAGTLYHMHIPTNASDSGERVFVVGLNRVLLLAGAASGLVALLAALLLSRRLLAPIESLTIAARRMGEGDLSQRVEVRTHDEIAELAGAFNSMAEGLARAERLRRNMVSDVAHELRTPLTNIRCQLETLQDGLARPTPELIDSLHEEAMLLNRLIDDLQDLALAEAGELSLEPRVVSVREETLRAAGALARRAADGDLHLSVEVPAELNVLVDPDRFAQVLRNLLSNALTHTPPGGRIEIRARRTGTEIEIEVADTGRGISRDALPFIFDRFYREDSSRNRATGGAGLGLAIVKHLVAAHGGRVWAESEAGRGSTFHFTVPVASRPAPEGREAPVLRPA
jgi:signal transduction histidine kinase